MGTYGPGRAELALALHALGAETASGASSAIDLADGSAYVSGCGARALALLDFDVTAASGMSAVTPEGTAPPALTLAGTPARAVNLVVECLQAGARGTWLGQWSADGGATWTPFTSAPSVVLGDTGLTLAIATGAASLDNVWTASTPTLAITVETSRDGSIWRPTTAFTIDSSGRPPPGALGAFDAAAVRSWQQRAFIGLERYLRVSWTVSAGASFTFAISGVALLVYAGLQDASALSLRAGSLADVRLEEIAIAAIAASDQTDQKLGARYQLPLVQWPMSVAKHTASIFALNAMAARGYAPEQGARDTFKDGYDRAIAYLDDVFSRGDPGIQDQNPPDDFNTGLPDPRPRNWDRGWTTRY